MPGCAVATCKSYSRNTKGKQIIYHSFPLDVKMQKVWIEKCKRKDSFNPKTGRICSLHFSVDSYVRDLKSELLGLPPKKRLKPDAVPTLNLPSFNNHQSCELNSISDFCNTTNSIPEVNRYEAREIRKRALESLKNVSPKKQKLDKLVSTEDLPFMSTEEQNLQKRISLLEEQNQKLVLQNNKLKAQNELYSKKLGSARKALRNCLKNRESDIKQKINRILSKVFTKKQIRCLLTEKKSVKWDTIDICRAITLRSVSSKCYNFLRNKMGIPLPGITTLRRWISRSFKCRPGILWDVITIMKTQAKKFKDLEKVCVISFDEMNVDSRISYDEEEDRIIGPHSNVQVAMVRGLFSKWKQPIYFDFDVSMTAATLNDIILNLEKIDFNIVAIVADLGPKNQKLWNELNINYLSPSFKNPYNSKRMVWVFADVPHLFKLIRNHFLDSGFTLPGNKKVTKAPIEQLLALDCSDLKMCPKLTQYHVTVKGRDRQRVHLATQLFSNHTAKGLRYLIPTEENLAKFIELLNDSFDILNSRVQISDRPAACGFGVHFSIQERILRQFYAQFQGLKVGSRKSFLPFQKGIFTTIRSLLGLYSDLKRTKNINYILTSRLNQDCLENFFSQIRGLGHFYDHPLPSDVKYRIKLLLLGANASDIPLSNASPVTLNDDSFFLTPELLGKITTPEMLQPLAMVEGSTEIRDIVLEESVEDNPVTPTDCPVEGFRYLAGYLAYRGRKFDRSLGTPTGHLLSVPDNLPLGWIETLSRNGLLIPSDDWLGKVRQFELLFTLFHGKNSLSRDRNVIKTLSAQISQKFPEVPKQIIKVYVRTRTFIRLKHMNAITKMERAAKSDKRKSLKWKASKKGMLYKS